MPFRRSLILCLKHFRLFKRAEYKGFPKRDLHKFKSVYYSSLPPFSSLDLKFPVNAEQAAAMEKCRNLIIIESLVPPEDISGVHQTQIVPLNIGEEPEIFELFKINMIWGKLSLFFDYSNNKNLIGEPVRDDYFIGELQPGRIYEILINGHYHDPFTHERFYTEYYYKVLYSGTHIIHPVESRNESYRIEMPSGKVKSINMRRLFY